MRRAFWVMVLACFPIVSAIHLDTKVCVGDATVNRVFSLEQGEYAILKHQSCGVKLQLSVSQKQGAALIDVQVISIATGDVLSRCQTRAPWGHEVVIPCSGDGVCTPYEFTISATRD